MPGSGRRSSPKPKDNGDLGTQTTGGKPPREAAFFFGVRCFFFLEGGGGKLSWTSVAENGTIMRLDTASFEACKSFENELGVTLPLKYFDPLGLSKDENKGVDFVAGCTRNRSGWKII